MQVCHIFTVNGLELQKKDIFDDPRADPDQNHDPLPNFFFDNYVSQKVSHPTLSLSEKMSVILQVNVSFFYFAKIQKRTGTLNKPDPMPDVIEH